MSYLLNANIFMAANNLHYRLDFCPAFREWLIAPALAHGHAVVTHEKPADTPHKIKIPNVCVGLGVKVMTPFEMLRRERARFVLGEVQI